MSSLRTMNRRFDKLCFGVRRADDCLIPSVFKTLTDQVITVELKNDLSITGTLKSVDQ